MGPDTAASVAVELQKLLTDFRVNQWLRDDVFHIRWWLMVGLFATSIFTWCKLVDKTRLPEIILHNGLTTILTLILDEFGEELVLWDYPVDVLPIFPPLTAVDLASLPIIYSLIYQYCSSWKSFLYATILMAAVFCFVLEPMLVWSGFYQLLKWKYYYGFPIYIIMAIFIRWLVIKIYSIAEKANEI